MQPLNYTEEYKRKADDDLLRIASEPDQLVPEANAAIKAEIARRGIQQKRNPANPHQENKLKRIGRALKHRSRRLLRPTWGTARTFAMWYVIAFVIFHFDIRGHGGSFQQPMPIGKAAGISLLLATIGTIYSVLTGR
jgi:hypothetical protein